MIEQEKAVEFRFDTSEKSLSERLTEIGLPAYARLFSCVGLPNIFAWKNVEKTESFQETWLFVPDNSLDEILNSQRMFSLSNAKHLSANNSFKVDNSLLYPIHSANKLSCIIVVPEDKNFITSPNDLEKLEKIEKMTVQHEKADTIQIAYEFVSRLFDCKQSYAEFAQRLLTFLTDQVDKSYAGLYWQGADSYHRRWAYGDLQFSDKVPLAVTSDVVEKWKDARQQGKSFIPAELVHTEPVFVQTPPSFLFVYQTPNFGDREQWLVMAVPGDISIAAISRLKIIAGLLSSIDDERITGHAELVHMFGELVQDNHKTLSVEEALKYGFKLLDGKLRLNSLCLLDTDNSVVSCMKITGDQLRVERNAVNNIPDRAREVMGSLMAAYLEGPSHQQHESNPAAADAGVAHVLFPVPVKEHSAALLSAEFCGDLNRARQYEPLFKLIAKFLGVCLSLAKGFVADPQIIGTPANEIAETTALSRLMTIGKLNGGYFHELIEYLSVILGQAEIMEHEIRKSVRPITPNELKVSTDRIVRAAGELAARLEDLKDVSTIKVLDSGKFVSAENFLNMLPAMTHGYFLTIRDNKNVEIEVQTKPDKNVSFLIPVLHIYDYIMPMILAIMDEALCSGKILVSVTEHFGRPALRISHPKKLLGKLPLEKLLDKVFQCHQIEKNEEKELHIMAEDARFIFSESEGDRSQFIYTLSNQNQPVEEFD